jgi:tetratricopeptide (TPR) repeat protein
MACLQQQRIELQALLREVEAGGGSRVDRALQALGGLDEALRCADIATLELRVAPLAHESTPRELELRLALAQVQAKMQLGLAESGLAAAEELMPKLLSANVPRLAAQGHAQLASLLEATGRLGEAREMYEAALSLSAASGDETQVAMVWIALVHLVGYTEGNHEVGRQLARVAEIALQRVPAREDLALRLRGNVAMLASSEGSLSEAEREFPFVAAGFERLLGQHHPRTLNALHNLGDVLRRRGTLEEARKIWQELLRVQEERFGREHSSTASTLMQLAHDEYQRGQIHDALARYQRVLKIRISALGAQSPQVAAAHTSVGLALSRNGAYGEARQHHQRALAIWTSTLGHEHSNVALALNNLASTEYKAKNLGRARDLYRQAYELRKASLGSEHISVATPLYNLGLVVKELSGNCTEAEPYWREVLALREHSLDPGHPHLAFPLTSIGECLLERGAFAEARPLLERALAIRLEHASAPSIAAETQFALARALWPQLLQRQRARQLAEAALSSLGTEPALAELQREVASWLSKRRR